MEDEQIHPLHETDKQIIDSLIVKKEPNDFDLINLARLINRYGDFHGEKDLKDDLEKILNFWGITRTQLFSKTRIIWSNNFKPNDSQEDLVGSGFDATN